MISSTAASISFFGGRDIEGGRGVARGGRRAAEAAREFWMRTALSNRVTISAMDMERRRTES